MAEPFITYKLTVPNIPLLHAEQSREILFREASLAVRAIVEDVASEARQRTPVSTGVLRASIATDIGDGDTRVSLQRSKDARPYYDRAVALDASGTLATLGTRKRTVIKLY